MTTLTFTHEAAEGTLLVGDPRPHHGILKANGFRWGRNVGWYVPNSRDKPPQTWRINAAAEQLRATGFEVDVEIDEARRTIAEVEADAAERSEARADRLADRADRLSATAESTLARARDMASIIPLGQPILVGHYSEGRDRNYRAKIDRTYDRGFEALRDGQEAERASSAATARQAQHESVPTTLRRIAKLEAEGRDIDRKLVGNPCPISGRKRKEGSEAKTFKCPICSREVECEAGPAPVPAHYSWPHDEPASGEWLAKLTGRKEATDEAIAYWKARVAEAEANGVKVWGPADFTKGDFAKTWAAGPGGWSEVVRVNKKSVTVKTAYPWTNTVPYDKVKGQRRAGPESDGKV